MSSKIDERIVGMKFQGDQFKQGVSETSSALEKLKKSLNLGDATKGLKDLDAAGKNFSLAHLADGVQTIASKFSSLAVIGITALANIANKAIDVGITLVKSLTIDPVKAGLAEYELKLGSIQTIMAGTGADLPTVNKYLDELNTYADRTIYSFQDMTSNIGKFTNAGVSLEDSVKAIQGVAQVAALSGANANEASRAMYNFSQALSSGSVRLIDWKSIENANMATVEFKTQLLESAVAAGTLTREVDGTYKTLENTPVSATKGFNDSLQDLWMTTEVLTKTLGDYTDETTDIGKRAYAAAQDVKTYTQLIDTLQEATGSGWAQTFEILIGDFEEAKKLWTAVNNEIGGMIDKSSDARNELLRDFKELGGRDEILSALGNIWQAAKMYILPIKGALTDIFPPITAKNLLDMAKNFQKFTESLKPSADTMRLLKRTFSGVFAVLDIGWMILKEVVGLFSNLFGAATEGAGGILEVTANIGDFLVNVRDAIKSGDALTKVFEFLGKVLKAPIDFLRKLGSITLDILGAWDFAAAWEAVANAFRKVGEFLAPVWEFLGEFFANAKKVITEFFETLDFNVLVGLLNFGALAGIGVGLKKAFDFLKGKGIMGLIFGDSKESGPGLMDKIKGVFGAITDTFGEMQNTLKSATLIGIGIAIALITASVVALSFVDTGKLFIVLGAMTIMFGQLSAMLLAIDKLTKKVNTGKMIGTAIALSILAGAMILMSTAVLILSTMDWVELSRGLSAMGVGLGILVGGMALLSKVKSNMMLSAGAIFIFATSMVIMAAALKIMATMSWDDILRSATIMAAAVGIMVGAGALAQKGIKSVGSMLILGVTLAIIAGSLKIFSTMSWDDVLRSITVMAATVGILVGAVAVLSTLKMAPVGAASMIAMSIAITILTGAMKVFSSMSWEEVGKSLVMLAGSLAILAAAMAIMGIPLVALGGLALLVVSAGLMMLAPALVLLGTMSWDAIGRGLTMLGASLLILAVGGLLLIPASVGFLLLGAAVFLIGNGMLMAGKGIAMFVAGFGALIGLMALGAPAITKAIEVISAAIPTMMAAFAQGLIDFALVIAGGAVEFTAAMVTLITSLMNAINETAPLVIETIWNLIVLLVEKIVEGVPLFVDAGMTILIALLEGIAEKLPTLMDAAGDVIAKFITGLGEQAEKIIKAGGDTVLKFINGIKDYIRENTNKFVTAGSQLFRAVIDGVSLAIERGGSDIRYAGSRIGSALIKGAMNALGINSPSKVFRDDIMGSVFEGVVDGADKNMKVSTRAGEDIGNSVIKATSKVLSGISSAVATDMNLSPTIKPVLDLSSVRADSSLIGGMLTPPTLKVSDSYAYASSIATERRATEEAYFDDYDDDMPVEGDTYNFYQTNTSPKALSAAEVYRQSNNLLSVIKKGKSN